LPCIGDAASKNLTLLPEYRTYAVTLFDAIAETIRADTYFTANRGEPTYKIRPQKGPIYPAL